MSKTMDYYRKNPKAYAKKKRYEMDRQKNNEDVKRKRLERKRWKYAKGLTGKMGNKDASHTKDGRLVLEDRGKNRRRNGEGGRRTKK